jgi:hypothetical protein
MGGNGEGNGWKMGANHFRSPGSSPLLRIGDASPFASHFPMNPVGGRKVARSLFFFQNRDTN